MSKDRADTIMDAVSSSPTGRIWLGCTKARNESCPRSMIETHGLIAEGGLIFARIQVMVAAGPEALLTRASVALHHDKLIGRAHTSAVAKNSLKSSYFLLPAGSLPSQWYRALPASVQPWAIEDEVFIPGSLYPYAVGNAPPPKEPSRAEEPPPSRAVAEDCGECAERLDAMQREIAALRADVGRLHKFVLNPD